MGEEPGPEVAALRTLFTELLQEPAAAQHIAHLLAGSDVRYEIGNDHRLSGRRSAADLCGGGVVRAA